MLIKISLQELETWTILRPFSKKTAEVLTDPYQSLTDHITDMRSRMSAVTERLQSNPLPKQAGEGEKDNSEIDIPSLLEDLSMGIDLLETKLQGNEAEQDVHPAIEEMENLLWSVEEKLGITPKLSEEEKAEPEHSEIVKEVEKESAQNCPVCNKPTTDVKRYDIGEGDTGTSYNHGQSWYEGNYHFVRDQKKESAATNPAMGTPVPATPAATTTTTPPADKPFCALCGGITFPDFGQYQKHMEFTHASDTMPTTPSQPTTASKKKADVITDETITTNDPNAVIPPVSPASPAIQNVQPTDDDNLEVPTQMPTSPLPPGQRWTWDAVNGVYVAMTDPTVAPGKII